MGKQVAAGDAAATLELSMHVSLALDTTNDEGENKGKVREEREEIRMAPCMAHTKDMPMANVYTLTLHVFVMMQLQVFAKLRSSIPEICPQYGNIPVVTAYIIYHGHTTEWAC